MGGVGACLPILLVFLLNWTTVLLVLRRPWDPRISDEGWDEVLDPKVDSMGVSGSTVVRGDEDMAVGSLT